MNVMAKSSFLTVVVVLLSHYTLPAQSTAPLLTAKQLRRLQQVKGWDIEFTYHFTDLEVGNGGALTCLSCGNSISDWAISRTYDINYSVQYTVRGHHCDPNYGGIVYDPPGTLTVTTNQYSNQDDFTFSSGCPRSFPVGPGNESYVDNYSANGTVSLDSSVYEKQLYLSLFCIDSSVNPPVIRAYSEVPYIYGLEITSRTGCGDSLYHEDPMSSSGRFSTPIYPYSDSSLGYEGLGNTQVRVENGRFVIRGNSSKTVDDMICYHMLQVVCDSTAYYPRHNSQAWDWLVREHPDSSIVLTRPLHNEFWIAGTQDTIRWQSKDTSAVDIFWSTDSGNTFKSVIQHYSAGASQLYVWDIPDTLLSTKSQIKIQFSNDTSRADTSDLFKLKGYVLTRMAADGNYEAFKPNIHGWNYVNGTLWPNAWWSQFNYATAIDPYTNATYPAFFQPISAAIFVDWPLWVNVFSVDAAYWSTFLGIYYGKAEQKWYNAGGKHAGSCFGFAASSFLAFNFKSQLLSKNPAIPNFTNLFSVPLTNGIMSVINGYYAYQFGKQSMNNDVVCQPKDPRTTLQEIKNMFIGDSVDIRTITIYNNGGGGGGAHSLAPIRVGKDNTGPSRYRVYLYDSNNPGLSTPYILIDSLNDTWTDFTGLGSTWAGANHCYLEIPVSNYLNTPVMGKQGRYPEDVKDGRNQDDVTGVNNIEFYNTSKANVMYTASNGKRIGLINGVVTDELDNAIAIFEKTGKVSDPIGYYIPDDNYSIRLSNVTDTSHKAYVSVLKQNVVYDYTRSNVDSSQVDRFSANEGFSVASPDTADKQIDLETIAEMDSSERIFSIHNTHLRLNDSLYMAEVDQDKLVLKNFGTGKSYDLEIGERSPARQGVFQHLSIALDSNSSQMIVPNWDSLDQTPVKIWVDRDNNGTIDDTILLVNQTTGVHGRGAREIPLEFNLAQNYPNPFNPSTTLSYSVPVTSFVTLTVYNIIGEKVAELVNGEQQPGYHDVVFHNEGLASGVYFCRLQASPTKGAARETFTQTRKLLLLR